MLALVDTNTEYHNPLAFSFGCEAFICNLDVSWKLLIFLSFIK